MTPNPILTVLSTLKKHRVKSLLIGGQACIIYGAVEFSRDSDFVLLNNMENLNLLKEALKDVEAYPVYVPPLELKYLEKGHACHFRCDREDVKGLRIDVMAKLKGCDPFEKLWERRYTISLEDELSIDIIRLKDLVQCKKTKRDKDWFMLKRLVKNDILMHNYEAPVEHIQWWFQECRDAALLIDLAKKYPEIVRKNFRNRPLLEAVVDNDIKKLNSGLFDEEQLERDKDKEYWKPLIKELEVLRHKK